MIASKQKMALAKVTTPRKQADRPRNDLKTGTQNFFSNSFDKGEVSLLLCEIQINTY